MTKPPTKKKDARPSRAAGRLALIAVAVVACFYPITKYYFAQDDFILLANSVYDRDATVSSTVGGDSDLFRPLTKIFYFGLMYRVFGLHPLPYHVVSLALHLLNVVLLFLLLRRFRNDRLSSLVVAAFFAFNLAFFDVVAWISCVQQLLGQTFMLVGMLLAFRAIDARHRGLTALGLSSYVLALLSLEQTYALPLVILIYAYSRERVGAAGARFSLAIREAAPYLVVMVAYLAYMAAVKGVPAEGPYQYRLGANVVANFLTYLDWTLGISALMPFVVDVSSTGLTAAHVVLVSAVIYNLAKGRKRIVWMASAYYVFTVLPALFLRDHVFHLHTYVPAVGIALLVAPVVGDFLETALRWHRRAAPVVAWTLIALAAIICFTKVRANETNYLRPDIPLPEDFVLRRAVIARNVLDDLRSKSRLDRPPRKLFLVYNAKGDWYKDNVVAALGRGSAPRLFYSEPDLMVRFADRGDTLSGYDPGDSRIFFFDYMGELFTPDEMNADQGADAGGAEPDTR